MGDPACHLASVCLSCGRFLEEAELAECPHCGHSLDEDDLSRGQGIVKHRLGRRVEDADDTPPVRPYCLPDAAVEAGKGVDRVNQVDQGNKKT